MLTIVQPGIQSTLQANRRTGFRHMGIGSAGPLDQVSMALANILVGNSRETSCIEIIAGTFSIKTDTPTSLSIAGHGYEAAILKSAATGRRSTSIRSSTGLSCNWRIELKHHETLEIKRKYSSGICYVATPDGFHSEAFLSSQSTDLFLARGGIDGRPLQTGDTFHTDNRVSCKADAALKSQGVRPLKNDFQIRAIAGPDSDLIESTVKNGFWRSRWRLGSTRSRMGIRLERDTNSSHFNASADLTKPTAQIDSHAVIPGTIQLPSGNKPIVLTSDCQTTGGYGKIAVVIAADLWKLAQTPQEVPIEFAAVDEATAIKALRQQERYLAYIENAVALSTRKSANR